MPLPPAHFYVLSLLLCSQAPFALAQSPASGRERPVNFRQSKVTISTPEAPALSTSDGFNDEENLTEKRQNYETQVQYAKAKLERAQKQLAILSQTGNVEQADKANQEVKDWEARLQAARAQLTAIDKELDSVNSATGSSDDTQLIAAGENLEIFVTEDSSFNGRCQVRRGGYIILPQVGRVPVAGKTIGQAEAAIRKVLQASQLQHATVLIERVAGGDVTAGPLIYLSGEFRSPRPYRIPAGTSPTLVSLFLSCGGVTDKADLAHVKVMRMVGGRSVVEEVNLQKILDGGSLSSDLTLTEGDVITIPAGESNLVYLTGRVAKPGTFRLTNGEKLMAYTSILQSGGFGRFADLRKVYILRAMPDGTKARVPLDIVAIQKGHSPDVQLQTNDIIVVPEKFFSF